MDNEKIMERALELAQKNVEKGLWPFSTIIVKDNKILAEAVNSVPVSFDPSDHAEIAAIRIATAKLKSADLSGAKMYVIGMPCPMCLTCCLFSNIKEIYYAVDVASKDKALNKLPLTDDLYNLIANDYASKSIEFHHLDSFSQDGVRVFGEWNDGQG